MNIEITRPEVKALIQQRLETGAFASPEDVILDALRSSEAGPRTGAEIAVAAESEARRSAGEKIRELRKGITLDRPEGTSLREYAHIGHRY